MNNRTIDVEALKQIQLEMLIEIHAYCHTHDIPYSLAYGTLLGAVRHGGYIPWDDDIDIMIPRADYEKFVAGFFAPNMAVLDHRKSPDYYLPFAKVVRTDTVMEEEVSIKSAMGVYIDVFPIDILPQRSCHRKLMLLSKSLLNGIYQFKVVRLSPHRSFFKNMVLAIGKFLSLLIPMRGLLSLMSRLSCLCADSSSIYCGPIADVDKTSTQVFPTSYFSSYGLLTFEGRQFNAITSYDAWLRQMYGDYMQLPPADKQVSHHVFNAYWK